MKIDLQHILEMWKKDCAIPKNNLDESSRLTPALHAKYMELLAQAKLAKKRAEFKQKSLLKDKWLYYNGKMTQEQIEEKGWVPDPFDGWMCKNAQNRGGRPLIAEPSLGSFAQARPSGWLCRWEKQCRFHRVARGSR